METTIDRFGRIVIPKDVREHLDLDPGSVLVVETHDHEIHLKPVRPQPDIVVKDGVMVFSGIAAGDVASAVRAHRTARIKAVSRRAGK
jgi:AbrB family looped-hinge helix DNA binding protein